MRIRTYEYFYAYGSIKPSPKIEKIINGTPKTRNASLKP